MSQSVDQQQSFLPFTVLTLPKKLKPEKDIMNTKRKNGSFTAIGKSAFSDYYQKMKKNLRQCDKKTESNQFLLTVGLMMQLFVLRQFAEWPIKLFWQKSIAGEINK